MLCAVILFLGFSDEPLLFRPSKVVGNVKDSRLENFVSVEARIQPIIHHFARKDDRHAVMNKGDAVYRFAGKDAEHRSTIPGHGGQ